jgi:tyrosyl-DNA phosphodiesterase-1
MSFTILKNWHYIQILMNFSNCLVLLQFSSLGSLDEKWLAELASSMSSGFSEDKTPLGLGQPRIIWPTVEDVRCSLEVFTSRSF